MHFEKSKVKAEPIPAPAPAPSPEQKKTQRKEDVQKKTKNDLDDAKRNVEKTEFQKLFDHIDENKNGKADPIDIHNFVVDRDLRSKLVDMPIDHRAGVLDDFFYSMNMDENERKEMKKLAQFRKGEISKLVSIPLPNVTPEQVEQILDPDMLNKPFLKRARESGEYTDEQIQNLENNKFTKRELLAFLDSIVYLNDTGKLDGKAVNRPDPKKKEENRKREVVRERDEDRYSPEMQKMIDDDIIDTDESLLILPEDIEVARASVLKKELINMAKKDEVQGRRLVMMMIRGDYRRTENKGDFIRNTLEKLHSNWKNPDEDPPPLAKIYIQTQTPLTPEEAQVLLKTYVSLKNSPHYAREFKAIYNKLGITPIE